MNNLIANNLIVEYQVYNHAINMARLYYIENDDLVYDQICISAFETDEPEIYTIIKQYQNKMKFVDYWNTHYVRLTELLKNDNVLGYERLYHQTECCRLYFKNNNEICYTIMPINFLKIYELEIDN